MELKNNIKKFPTFLTDEFKKIIDMPAPARTDGFIYKRFPSSRTGKFTEEEMEYLVTNQIPF